MTKERKWNFDEFLTFIMIYASNVDFDFSKEERDKIMEKAKDGTFQKMEEEFMSMNDFEALQTILSYKGIYFPTIARKKEILDKIKLIFFADGEYSIMEREMLHFLDKLM